MDTNRVTQETKGRLDAIVAHFAEELSKLRAGRAHPGMLDSIKVEAYGTTMPLVQVAGVTAPEAQLLQITPFDPGNLQAIAAAIRNDQSLGFNPVDDGRVVRVAIPPLTAERRQQIVKQLHDKLEECMIGLRQARHDALRRGDQAKKDKTLGDDQHARFKKQLDQLVNDAKTEAERLAKNREQELLTV